MTQKVFKIFAVMALFLAIAPQVWANHFSYTYQGQTLYYDNINDMEVEVSSYQSITGALTIPDSVTYNGHTYAVTSIGESAFFICSLTSVTIPRPVKSIGSGAFGFCHSLTSVIFNADSCTYAGRDHVFYGTTEYRAFRNCSNITSFTFGDNVTVIPQGLCKDLTRLTSVTIPNSVNFINDSAFYNCSNLNSVTIGNSVRSIGNAAFENCTRLAKTNYTGTVAQWAAINIGSSPILYSRNLYMNDVLLNDLVFPDTTTVINSNFSYDTALHTVTIPNSVTFMGNGAFYSCIGLMKTNYIGTAAQWASIMIASNPIGYSKNLYLNDVLLTDLVFPDTTTVINSNFAYDTALHTVTIPIPVTLIKNNAFYYCRGLTSVAFSADSCVSAGTNYDNRAFIGCTSVTNFTFGDNVKVIPSHLCCGMTGLTSVTIPNSVKSLGDYVFRGCTALTTAVIGNGVRNIPTGTFADCNHLTNLTIGSGVQSIAPDAFSGCNAVLRMSVRATTPPTATSNPFTEFNTSIPVTVPCESVNAYQTAPYWGFFTNISGETYSFSATSADPTRGSVQVIHAPDCSNLQAEVQANAYNGFRFVRWSDGNTEAHRYIVVTQDTAIQAYFESSQGIENVIDGSAVDIYVEDGRIHVSLDGNPIDNFRVYDVVGREVKSDTSLPNGVYIIKVGNFTARKIVVVR